METGHLVSTVTVAKNLQNQCFLQCTDKHWTISYSDGNAIEHGLDSGYGIDKVKFTSVGTGAAGYNVDTEYFVTNNFSNGANASTEKGLALSTVQMGLQ